MPWRRVVYPHTYNLKASTTHPQNIVGGGGGVKIEWSNWNNDELQTMGVLNPCCNTIVLYVKFTTLKTKTFFVPYFQAEI